MAGPQSIKLTEIAAYLQIAGEGNADRRGKLARMMLVMDSAFLNYLAKNPKTSGASK